MPTIVGATRTLVDGEDTFIVLLKFGELPVTERTYVYVGTDNKVYQGTDGKVYTNTKEE